MSDSPFTLPYHAVMEYMSTSSLRMLAVTSLGVTIASQQARIITELAGWPRMVFVSRVKTRHALYVHMYLTALMSADILVFSFLVKIAINAHLVIKVVGHGEFSCDRRTMRP